KHPKTAIINAGDTVGFGVGEPVIHGPGVEVKETGTIYHPGYGSAWMSKAPSDDLDGYDGSGEWFKILQIAGPTEQSRNFTGRDDYDFEPTGPLWGTYEVDSVSPSCYCALRI